MRRSTLLALIVFLLISALSGFAQQDYIARYSASASQSFIFRPGEISSDSAAASAGICAGRPV